MIESLAMIVPSRGRPESVKPLMEAVINTADLTTTWIYWVLDLDDPSLLAYDDAFETLPRDVKISITTLRRTGMVGSLNKIAFGLSHGFTNGIGFMGDDHRPRTNGWDQQYIEHLNILLNTHGAGIVYGNDMLQGRALPTQVAMTSNIISAIGYMVPPILKHMYADNFWLELGKACNIIKYLPEVVIEHMHPAAGKAPNSEQYAEVARLMGPDKIAYDAYKADGQFHQDVSKVLEQMLATKPISNKEDQQ